MKCVTKLLRILPIIGLCLLVSGVMIQTGCHVKDPTIKTEKYKRTIRVACVGDSITFGDKIQDRDLNSYPAVLGRLLGTKFDVRNFGVNGATLLKHGNGPYWNTGAFTEAQDYNPDVVIIMLGTNDSKPQNWEHKDDFMGDLRALITRFRYLPSKPLVWLCTPCPVYENGQWGITPSVISNEILPAIRHVAEECDTPLIDLYSTMNYKSELFPDTVHPNEEGAELMARTIATALTGI